MNRIWWDSDKVSVLTDCIEAAEHSHCMLQFFLSLNDNLHIRVSGEEISCKCIIVDKNVRHAFSTGKMLHFTCILDPFSGVAERMKNVFAGRDYHIFDTDKAEALQSLAGNLLTASDTEAYVTFMKRLYELWGVSNYRQPYDERIVRLLELLEHCDCDNHAIAKYADALSVSPSRLSHLFREQTGIPLKNYLTLHQLERAFTALLGGESITGAALNAGFDSPSHFAATVKRMMGLPASSAVKDSEFLKVY